MPRRSSHLNGDVLQDIAGRLRFGASSLEDRLDNGPKPEPKPWAYPEHPLDKVASAYGMRGFEFKALQEGAMRKLEDHTLLQHYYRRFLMAAKLVLDDELERVRQHERKVSEDRNLRDTKYQGALRAWENRNTQITKSWTAVRETIRTRWNKLGRGMVALIESDARLSTMSDRDVAFLEILESHGIVVIDHQIDQVKSLNWDRFQDTSIEDVNEIILELNGHQAGGFIKTKEPA